jgi:hypothetical protein
VLKCLRIYGDFTSRISFVAGYQGVVSKYSHVCIVFSNNVHVSLTFIVDIPV